MKNEAFCVDKIQRLWRHRNALRWLRGHLTRGRNHAGIAITNTEHVTFLLRSNADDLRVWLKTLRLYRPKPARLGTTTVRGVEVPAFVLLVAAALILCGCQVLIPTRQGYFAAAFLTNSRRIAVSDRGASIDRANVSNPAGTTLAGIAPLLVVPPP